MLLTLLEKNVDYAIEDDGTGRYSVAGGTFVWNGSSYANLNLPTTVLATEEETQTITITVTGQSTGIQDTVEFDLTDLVSNIWIDYCLTCNGRQ